MSRPKKQKVDFFPHYCHHGKTMFIVEQRFGNDGYAFWFKLLELLGDSNGHVIDCRNPPDWEFLLAKTRIEESTCEEILNLLAKLEAIDPQLWSSRLIWSDNFVQGIAKVYQNRSVKTPEKPDNYTAKPCADGVSTTKNPQSRVEESKTPPLPPPQNGGANRAGDFGKWFEAYPENRRKDRLKAEKVWGRLARSGRLPPLAELLAVLGGQKRSEEWTKEEGRYVLLPWRYLKQGRFVDASAAPAREGAAREPPAVTIENAHKFANQGCPDCGGKGVLPDRFKIRGKDVEGKKVCECTTPRSREIDA